MANVIEKAEDYVSSATISMGMLRDKLSEFLAVERGGLKLYDEAVRIVTDPQVSKQFEIFRDQTRRHESILIQVMEQLGLDPRYLSPAGKVAQQKANGLLSTMTSPDGLPTKAAEINAIENIVLAETKDHAEKCSPRLRARATILGCETCSNLRFRKSNRKKTSI